MFCSCEISTDKHTRGPSAIAELLENFECAIHMSGMAKARAVKFCMQRNYIKSCQRDDAHKMKCIYIRLYKKQHTLFLFCS